MTRSPPRRLSPSPVNCWVCAKISFPPGHGNSQVQLGLTQKGAGRLVTKRRWRIPGWNSKCQRFTFHTATVQCFRGSQICQSLFNIIVGPLEASSPSNLPFFQVVNNFDHLNKKGRLDGDDASNGQNPKKIRHVPTPSNKKQELSTTSRATQTEHWVRMGPNPSDRRQE